MNVAVRSTYEVIRQLGEGGIGRVYEAVHHPSGRAVAIKTLRTEHGEASAQRLLLNEAAAAAQLAHPSIVELLDVGRDDRGSMFLVMELVRGSSLDSWSSKFPGLSTALRAFEEILDALAAAHAQGIVHGDLKPGNVLLTEDGRVKVTDFGIAHVIDPLRLVERRGVQGTPYYMAPEQLVDPASIGPSTDLYAVGVMLYEMIAGREPYAANGTLADILARKLAEVPRLVARPGLVVPAQLAKLVADLLDPNPRTRPRFAARVREAIADFARHVPEDRAVRSGELRAPASTWVESPLASAPTIQSSPGVPVPSGSSRSLPFSLPCVAGAEPEVGLHRLRQLPLLGRSTQAERLLALAADVVTEGGARAMIVSGRAGEGKTRLVRHGFAEVERTGTMLGAAASFDETIANAQVGLRACIGRLLGTPVGTFEETMESRWSWLARVPQPGVDFASVYEWLAPGSRPLAPTAAAEKAATCVLAASRVHPIYLWLDDVAWSRDGAMELVLRLLERNDARVLVVGTLRSGTAEHPDVRKWLLAAAKAGAHLEMLPRLETADRAALVEAAGPVEREVAREIAEQLDEPTLVLVETVRGWIDEGALVPSDRGYVLREGARASELAARAPETVIARRVATLLEGFGPDRSHAERILGYAALLGVRFEERVLRACADAAPYVDRVLDRALLTGLLRVDGRGAYRFEHRLFLDAIVEACARRSDASAIYRATADALAGIYGDRSVATGLATAALYRAGGDRDNAAKFAAQTVRALSRAALYDAADRAMDLLASWVEADAVPEVHVHRALLEAARGQRAYFGLDYPTARKHLRKARDIYATLGATGEVHNVLFDISSTHFYQDQFADAARCISFVETSEIVDPIAHARGYHRLAELASIRGDLPRAIAHQQQACALSDNDVYFIFVSHTTLAELQIAAGYVSEAQAALDRAVTVAETLGDRYLDSDLEYTRGALEAARGYFAAARARALPRLQSLLARNDKWHVTSVRALLLLCSAGSNAPEAELESDAATFAAAYREVPHDEPLTWWLIRAAAVELKRHGHHRLADEVRTLLMERLDRIARALDEDEPTTEDEAARSDAATRASSR